MKWTGKYHVQGVSTPPPAEVFIGTALEQGTKEEDQDSVSKVLEQGGLKVPPGYVARSIRVDHAGEVDEEDWYWELIVGNREWRRTRSIRPPDRVYELTADEQYNDIIPVSLVVKHYGAFTVNIVIRCERTTEKMDEWRLGTYESIMTRYLSLKAEYEDQVVAAELQDGPAISGLNPVANRQIERNELKRLSISVISGQNFDLFNTMSDSGNPLYYPQINNFAAAEEEGAYIQFLEQAIEWQYMTYVFYPYFWGRKAGWVDAINTADSDPIFDQFLRAGAARVQVPIRPGFLEAMDYFLKTGRPWLGGSPPQIEDEGEEDRPPFIPIVQELKEQTGAEFEDGAGTLQVITGSKRIRGTDTAFLAPRDVDREIRIRNVVYRIREVVSATEILLWEDYGETRSPEVPYALGPKLVGQPWEVRLPTTLVMLQTDAELPSF